MHIYFVFIHHLPEIFDTSFVPINDNKIVFPKKTVVHTNVGSYWKNRSLLMRHNLLLMIMCACENRVYLEIAIFDGETKNSHWLMFFFFSEHRQNSEILPVYPCVMVKS